MGMVAYIIIMKTINCECHYCGAKLVRNVQSQKANVRVHFCDNKCKGQHQRLSKPVTREWLIEHYVEKNLNTTQIGEMVNRDPKSVWSWLKDLGIPTRPRGSDTSRHFRKGGPNLFKGRKHSPETRKRLSEIAKADGRVPYDRAVGPPFKGKRGPGTPNWKGGVTPDRQALQSSPEWRAAVSAVKKRDRNTCRRCGKVKVRGDGAMFDVHHIVSFACVELRCVESNLVYLCEPCHYWVHGNENINKDFIKENQRGGY